MELTLSSNESSQLRLVTVKISETRVGRGALKCSIAASELQGWESTRLSYVHSVFRPKIQERTWRTEDRKVTDSASVFSPCTKKIFLSFVLSFFLFSFFHSFFLSCSDFFLPIHCKCTGSFFPVRAPYDTHTHTFCKTVLNEGSTCRTDLYLITQNTHKRQISLKPGGFEPTTPASERPQTHALDSAATEIGSKHITKHK